MSSFIIPSTVLITGCDRGIGLELTRQIRNKWPQTKIIATVLDLKAATTNSELSQLAEKSKLILIKYLDTTKEETIINLAEELSREFNANGVNLLINNAGIMFTVPPPSDLDDFLPCPRQVHYETTERMMRTFETNVVGTFNVTKHLIPLLKKYSDINSNNPNSFPALIMNITSRMGSITCNTSGGRFSYRASKSALNTISKSFSVDLKPLGIGCIAVHPGWVSTSMGGPSAEISPQDCVSGILSVIQNYTPEKSGKFLSFDNTELPW